MMTTLWVECPMRDTDRLYEELEEPGKGDENLFRLTPDACGWLARHIRIQVQLEREQMYEEVQRELTVSALAIFVFSDC